MKEGWELRPLSGVCELYQPKTIAKSQLSPDGTYPVFGANGIIGRHAEYNHKDPVLLITCRGATCGAVNVSLPFSWINGNAMVVKPKNDGLLKEFLRFLFSGALSLRGVITGSAQPQITRKSLSPLSIPVPPIGEQKAIVTILDEAFAAIDQVIENTKRNLASAREVFDSVLNDTFTRKGDDWQERKLGDVCELARGGSPRPIKDFLTKNHDGVNWIKISDATASGKYIYETAQKIKPEGVARSRMVNDGDLLLSNSMSFGRPYIMRTSGCIHDGWLVLTKLAEAITSDYLYLCLGSRHVFKQFDALAAGSTVRNLNIRLVGGVSVPVPPIEEQKAIVAKLDALSAETQRLEAIYQRKLEALDELKQSILQKAFLGELTKDWQEDAAEVA